MAVVWACKHYHIYVYAKPVHIFTEHKPLTHIHSYPKARPSVCIERRALPLQPYSVTILFKSGKDIPTDYLSGHPPPPTKMFNREERIAVEYISYLATNNIPKAISMEELTQERVRDETLQAAIAALRTNKWNIVTYHRWMTTLSMPCREF